MADAEALEHTQGIAIVGMAGRFPGARSIDELWRNLREGVESISFFSDEELLASGLDPATVRLPGYVKAKGLLADSEWFDAAFFGFTPREADIMDPQHRLFFECAWEALEHAGYDAERYHGAIGVYAGSAISSYLLNNLMSVPGLVESLPGLQTTIGNDKDHLSTYVSYKLNLRGPSINIQTACSTSLVAVHIACQGLLNGECDMALAGGVTVTVPLKTGYLYQAGGITSPDGHCRAFDSRAEGTVGGNGVALVVLKRLADALSDGDRIHAVIRGSAINNDGSAKVGYTAPSVDAQAEVIAVAQEIAGVEPESIGYIETHGTGTALGDPIEIAALTQAFRAKTDKKGFCAIGSVKTNVGHLDVAAGVTGLIKTVLALEHKQLPASLHFEKPNPKINFANSPFYVNATLSDWKSATPRRAGVSALGMGGTNAHVVLEEAPLPEDSDESRPWQLLVLSAKTSTALDSVTVGLAEHFREHADANLADVAYTLRVGRKPFPHRRAVVCRDVDDALSELQTLNPAGVHTTSEAKSRPVAFLFPGQGTQYATMGAELYSTEPAFREHVDRSSELLRPHLGMDLRDMLYPRGSDLEAATRELNQTRLTQPALFVTEYALARLWMTWGLRPQAMIGHSIGEYVAACLAGVFSLEDALALVATRGRLMQQAPPGAMLAVPLGAREVQTYLDDRLDLAAINEPSLSVVSGPFDAIDALEARLAGQGLSGRRLHTSHAFHSAMMGGVLERFTEEVARVRLSPPEIPFVSNVTGTWISAQEATDAGYWARHLRHTVRFADGVRELLMERDRLLLEVGPGRTLSTLVGRHPDRTDQHVLVSSMRSAVETRSDRARVLDALGRVWAAGSDVDWTAVHAGERRHRVPVPTYPFERQRYWIEPQRHGSDARRPEALRKQSDIANWFYYPSWKRTPPVPSEPDETAERPACWLVFTDSASGLGADVVSRLNQIGNEVWTVAPGEHFTRLGERAFSIDPRNAEHYTALVGELEAGGKTPGAILHLWGVGPRLEIPPNGVDFRRAQDRGFYSLLFLAQALGSQHRTDPVHVAVVTSDVQDVTGEEALCPEKATALGACKVIPQEYPNITCRHVDIAAPFSGDWQADAADRIVAEALAQSTDVVVALRGNHRWVQIFEPVGQKRRTERATRLRERGVYLITGGLGGVGLEVARHLARTVHARLILTGRSTMPEPDHWEEWLTTHDVENDVSRKIRKVRALEALGAEVLIATADVADPEQMKALVRRAEARFGPMNGAIHAAGAEKRLHRIQETGRPEWEEQLRPKLAGLIVLDDVLRERDLDFRLLQSSLSSVLGAVGMVAYTAAHIFMDALASKRNRTAPGSWTVANWDNWLTWKEVDQGVTPSETSLFMTPDEGAAALHEVLSMGPIDHVVVSTGPLQARIDQWVKLEFLRQEEGPEAQGTSSAHSRPSLKTAYIAPATEAEKVLADIWAKTLGFDRVGIHDNFFELGGDSVLTLQIIAKASKAGLQITHQQIFERGTVSELAAMARPSRAILADQGPVTGPVPLTPIQQWFFERNLPDPHHYNLPVVLDVPHGTDPRLLEQAIQAVALHHDALRLRFVRREGGWHQVNAGAGEAVPFARLNLSGRTDADQAREMEAAGAQLQTSLNLTDGPLMRAAFVELAAPQSSRLLLVAHHLLADVVSWRTVLEDLETAYAQLGRGEAVKLPPKTTSFKHWADGLTEYAQSAAARSELPYWLALSEGRISSLPADVSGAPNTEASRRVLSISLSVDQTRALLQEAPAVYNVQAHEVLLTALVQSAARWSGVGSLLVDLEGHGREGIVAGVDLSRTVGWFTTIFPMLLDLGGATHPGEALKAIKEQVRQLPARGVGYGVLRYLTADPEIARAVQTVPRPEISFLYLGQVDHNATAAARFKVVHEPMGPSCSAPAIRSHLLEVVAQVVDSRLRLDWAYSDNVHRRATIEHLAEGLIESLDLLFAHCRSSEATSYTPSDFPGAKLSQDDLDRLIAQIR